MNALTIVKMAAKYNVELMGDDFIGYKFIGEDSDFWNEIINKLCNHDEISNDINKSNLIENNISFSDFNSKRWNI